jgi:hypothetical protein
LGGFARDNPVVRQDLGACRLTDAVESSLHIPLFVDQQGIIANSLMGAPSSTKYRQPRTSIAARLAGPKSPGIVFVRCASQAGELG